MISMDSHVMYIHEPFNCNDRPRLWSLGFENWFKYISHENGYKYKPRIKNIFTPDYSMAHLFNQVNSKANSLKDIGRLFRDYMITLPHRVRGSTPLIKDPIALLSAEWLEEVYEARVVVMVRHPAAFVGSLKVKNWTFPFEDLLNQSDAMRNHFGPYRRKVLQYAQTDKDIVDQASFLWKLLYSVVSQYQESHPEWTFVRHEDIVQDPIPYFRRIYKMLGLNFTSEIKNKIEKKTDPSTIRNWKKRLTEEEINRVRKKTEPVASTFYASTEW